jgi:hypothetical protein
LIPLWAAIFITFTNIKVLSEDEEEGPSPAPGTNKTILELDLSDKDEPAGVQHHGDICSCSCGSHGSHGEKRHPSFEKLRSEEPGSLKTLVQKTICLIIKRKMEGYSLW